MVPNPTPTEPTAPASALRVLFVDDDTKVLSGLARICYSLDPTLTVHTAPGGPEALAFLQANLVDAVVTDLHMPGMNGADLLEQVHDRHPAVLRFVLSGEAKPEIFLKANTHALRCFSKPCEIATILEAIRTALATLSQVRDPAIARLITNLGGLPSSVPMLTLMQQLLVDPDTDVTRIVAGIRNDPSVVIRILKTANSPFFGRSGKVETLDDAVLILGQDLIAGIVATQSIFSHITPPAESGLIVSDLWGHCAHAATIVRSIAPCTHVSQRIYREALTSALLHDIGKLVFAFGRPAGYATVQHQVREAKLAQWELETEVFGNSHAEIGAALLNLWGFPDSIIKAIACHHVPHRQGGQTATPAVLVHIADYLEHMDEPEGASLRFDGPYLQSLGLPADPAEWRRLLQG